MKCFESLGGERLAARWKEYVKRGALMVEGGWNECCVGVSGGNCGCASVSACYRQQLLRLSISNISGGYDVCICDSVIGSVIWKRTVILHTF
jgi:hypothetical protein